MSCVYFWCYFVLFSNSWNFSHCYSQNIHKTFKSI